MLNENSLGLFEDTTVVWEYHELFVGSVLRALGLFNIPAFRVPAFRVLDIR